MNKFSTRLLTGLVVMLCTLVSVQAAPAFFSSPTNALINHESSFDIDDKYSSFPVLNTNNDNTHSIVGNFTLTLPDITADPGNTICLPMVVTDFEGILGMQFSVNYSAANLTYTGAQSFNADLLGWNVGSVGNPSAGNLTFTWNDPLASGVTLIDATPIVELCFTVGNNNSTVSFSGNPTSIEVIDVAEQIVAFNSESSTVTVNGSTGGGGNGGGNSTDFTLSLPDVTADQGDMVCLPMTVSNFTDILGMQFSVNYSAANLTYTGAQNFNADLLGWNVGSVGNPSAGNLTFTWNDPLAAGLTLTDGTAIVELCFTVSGSNNSMVSFSSSPTTIEVINTAEQTIAFNSESGTVIINGNGGGGGGNGGNSTDFTLGLPDVTADQGDMICLPMTVSNFTDILGMQFSVNYSAANLTYTGAQNFNADLLGWNVGSVGNPSAGNLTFTWNDPLAAGVTLADGTAIVELCFTVSGSNNSMVSFSSNPTTIEVINTAEQTIAFNSESGMVTINGNGGGGNPVLDGFTLILPDVNVMNGDMICLPITVHDFTNILGMQFSINYDAAALTYTGAQTFNADLLGWNVGSVGSPSAGNLTFTWNDPLAAGVTLTNATAIVELCFTVTGANDTSTTLTFSGNPTTIEVIDTNENIVDFSSQSGTLTIGPVNNAPTINITLADLTTTMGSNICIPMAVTGFTDIVDMQMNITYNSSILSYTGASNFNASLPSWMASSITNPSAGTLSLAWSGVSTTLGNGTTIVELCFDVIGSTTTNVNISNPSVENSAAESLNVTTNNSTVTQEAPLDGFNLILPDMNVMNGDMICLPITVHDFTNILGMQFSINYDAAALTYTGAQTFNADLLGWNVGSVGNPSAGNLTFTWNDPLAAGVTLSNGTAIVELCFTVTGANDTSTTLTFSGNPTTIEVIDNGENVVDFNSQSGTLTIGPVNNAPTINITLADLTTTTGSNICIPMTVTGFMNIVDMQMNVTYNSSVLTYTGAQNFNASIPAWMASSVTNPSVGTLSLAWSGASTILNGGSIIVELCFDVVGAMTSNVTISNPSVENDAAESLNVTMNNSTVTIEPPLDGFTLILPDVNVVNGEMICLPITVHDFTNILGMQFSVNYDAAALTYTGAQNFNSDLLGWNIGSVGSTNPGDLTFAWNDPLAIGVTLANGTAIVELCFTVTGANGTSTTLVFSGSPTSIEIIDGDENTVDFNSQSGTLTIAEIPAPSITFMLGDESGMQNENVCLPITVLGFNDVESMQFSINYDQANLDFTGVQNLNALLPGLTAASFTDSPPNNISFTWNNAPNQVTLPGNTVIAEVCFDIVGNQASDVCFSETPTAIEVRNGDGRIFDFSGICGSVGIDLDPPGVFVVEFSEEEACTGDDFCIGLRAVELSNVEGMEFSITYNTGDLSFTSIADMNTAALPGLSLGAFNTATAGVVSFDWSNSNNTGSNLTAGDILFSVCFSKTSDNNTNVSIGGTPTPINIQDSNGNQVTYNGLTGTVTCDPALMLGDVTIVDLVCEDDHIGSITINNMVNGSGNYTYLWGGAASSQGNVASVTGLGASTIPVTITDNTTSQTVNTIFNIIGPPALTISVDNITNINCAGDNTGSITVSASGGVAGYTYDWSGDLPDGDGTIVTQNNLPQGTNYGVTVTDQNGCTKAFNNIQVNELNVALTLSGIVNLIPGDGQPGSIDLTVTGGGGGNTYAWTGPNYNANVEDPNNITTPGDYTVVVTDVFGCTATNTFSIYEVLRLNIFDITKACSEESNGAIDVTVAGGNCTGGYDFEWTVAGNSTVVSTAEDVSGLAPATYRVIVSCGEDAVTLDFVVGENNAIELNGVISPSTTGTNGNVNLSVSGGTPDYTYNWDSGQTSEDINNLSAGTYCVTVTDDSNCTAEACYQVSASPLIAVASAVDATCNGFNDGNVIITIEGGVSPYAVVVDPEGLNLSNANVTNGIWMIENVFPAATYDFTATDAQGETISGTFTVGEPDALVVTSAIIVNDTEDNGGTGSITLVIEGGIGDYSVTWNAVGLSGSSIFLLTGGSGNYIATIKDENDCTIEETYIVGQLAVDAPAVIENVSCANDENGSIVVNVTGGLEPYTYQWVSAGNSIGGNEPTLTGIPTGTYFLNITDASGATMIRNYQIGAQSNFAINAIVMDYPSCFDSEDGSFQSIVSNQGASTTFSYEWEDSNGAFIGTGETLDGVGGEEPFTLTVIDNFMCEETTTVNFDQLPQPMTLNETITLISCAGENDGAITVVANGGTPPYAYAWSTGAVGTTISNLAAGVYTVSVTDANQCQFIRSFELEETTALMLLVETTDDTGDCNGKANAVIIGGTPPYTYNWTNVPGNPDIGLVEGLCFGTYLLQVTDSRGCSSVLVEAIVVNDRFDCFEERVVITPDGNGSNDEFILFCVDRYLDSHLQIYNRWGQLVFETDNYDNTWEGTSLNGENLPAGPYYWILNYTGENGSAQEKRGSLSIVRD